MTGARWRIVLAGVAALAGLVLYEAWLLARPGGERLTVEVGYPVQLAAAVAAPVLMWLRARAESDRSMFLGLRWLVAGTLLLATGQAVKTLCRAILDVPISPAADVVILLGTACAVMGVLRLGGPSFGGSAVRRLLDGGIVAVAVLLLSWLTVMREVFEAGPADLLDLGLALTHPIAEVVPAVIIVSTLSQTRRRRPELIVGGLATVLFIVGDGGYAYLVARHLHPDAPPTDAGVLAGYLLLCAATQVGRDQPVVDQPERAWWQVVLPYVPLVLAGGVVLANVAAGRPVDVVSDGLLTAVILLVLLRQLTAVADLQRLTGRLNGTVAALERTLSEREILIEQAPVGICRLDATGRVLSANQTMQAMLRASAEELEAHPFDRFLHPAERERDLAAARELVEGRLPANRLSSETRLVRPDGTSLWCSQVASVVRGSAGQHDGVIAIVQDITERRRQAERAAHIQRQLLPGAAPVIEGYQLAGACLPANDVAGDFYDWVVRDDGRVDVTLADVMGKGIGAGLVMAVLRTALRSASPQLGPAAQVRVAARSLALGLTDEGLFVTLFQARLDPATGELRYVDAGHGYCAIRRRDGELVRLTERSLPVGVLVEDGFREGAARLGPGDALVAYSDGLVEGEHRTLTLEQVTACLTGSDGAGVTVERLLRNRPARLTDDVTVLVVTRED